MIDIALNSFPYTFKSLDLLKEALTIPSSTPQAQANYQRLEFLGDAVLQLLISERLYKVHPMANEGELTLMRKNLVSGSAIYERRERIYNDFPTLITRYNINYQHNTKAIIDVIEALIGAAWLDGGMEAAKVFVFTLITHEDILKARHIDAHEQLENPKGVLQEKAQKRFHLEPTYVCLNKEGPNHQPTFTCAARVLDYEAHGQGPSLKAAEAQAATHLLTLLEQQKVFD